MCNSSEQPGLQPPDRLALGADGTHAPAVSRVALITEAVFPVLAGQAYIWGMPHDRPRWMDVIFGVVIITIVLVYVGRRGIVSPRIFGLTGRRDMLGAAVPIGAFTLATVAVLLAWGLLSEKGLRQDWDLLWSLGLYPIWGFIQQGLMLAIIYPRLKLVTGVRWAQVLTALLFAAAHTPNPLLMAGGALMVLVYARVWERWPSLVVVAISHGVIGAVCDKALHVSMRVGRHYLEG